MRAVLRGLLLAVCLAACGGGRTSTSPGAAGTAGSGGSSAGGGADGGTSAGTGAAASHELHVRVTGGGTIHGAALACRSDCRVALDKAAHLEATPDSNWKFDGWQGDCAGAAACDLDPSGDRSVTAAFSPAPPVLVHIHVSLTGDGQVVSSPAGVDCPKGPCELAVPAGTQVTLTAHPGSGATFSGWGRAACQGDPCTFVASDDVIVYAGFAPARYTLTVQVVGAGRVQSSPAGIDCPGRCSAPFEAHSMVSLHAAPDAGNYFHDWGTACGDAYGPDCPAFLHGDYSMTATFSATQRFFKLVVYQSGYGSGRIQSDPPGIDCTTASQTCLANFAWGTQVNLSASAAPGSTFSGWQGSCAGTGPCSVQVTSDRFVLLSFDAPAPAGRSYTVRELPAVEGSQDMLPSAMNSRGDVVGNVKIPSRGNQPILHAFFYDAAAGTSARIGDDGTSYQVATGINDARQISLQTSGGDQERVYRWEAGALTLVAGPPAFMANSSGIDAKGNVYGATMLYPDPFHAYLWDGTLHDLGKDLGASTSVFPPDATGRLYGTMNSKDGTHLIEFAGGGIHDYGVPFPGLTTGKIGGGRMVGGVDPFFMLGTAYVYELPNGPLRAPLGIRAASLAAINSKGEVVGALDDANTAQHAILVVQDRFVDLTASLNDPSWNLISATAINDQGQIAGYGTKDGHRAAFLLTPRQ